MRISSRGQVTIPKAIREQAGLLPGTEVEFRVDESGVHIVKAAPDGKHPTRGELLVARLRGKGDFKMTTDEIMAMMRGDQDA